MNETRDSPSGSLPPNSVTTYFVHFGTCGVAVAEGGTAHFSLGGNSFRASWPILFAAMRLYRRIRNPQPLAAGYPETWTSADGSGRAGAQGLLRSSSAIGVKAKHNPFCVVPVGNTNLSKRAIDHTLAYQLRSVELHPPTYGLE